jgi:hypothetical protein
MSYEATRAHIFKRINAFEGADFDELALEVFHFQARYNDLYRRYLSLLGVAAAAVSDPSEIPFLPIQFFRNYRIKTGEWREEVVFSSSGTTGASTSFHAVRSLSFYRENARRTFRHFYGDPAEHGLLALLPSYLERSGSSLVCMVEHFISLSRWPQSGFFLNNIEELRALLREVSGGQSAGAPARIFLLGVSFALLDLAERFPLPLKNVIVMETGGMKGRRRELTREELHSTLATAFHLSSVHSEYGMTELFSQAYSQGEGVFQPGLLMRVYAREMADPLALQQPGKTGVLNVMDLANFDTCSFIATDDLGRVGEDGSFEVLGRVDNSDIRGCNLLVG